MTRDILSSGGSRGGAQRGPRPPPPPFLGQAEARRAEKIFLETGYPPCLRVWMTPPPPRHLSEYLDPPLLSLSKPKTTTYGFNSFSYFSANQQNALKIQGVTLNSLCCPYGCEYYFLLFCQPAWKAQKGERWGREKSAKSGKTLPLFPFLPIPQPFQRPLFCRHSFFF